MLYEQFMLNKSFADLGIRQKLDEAQTVLNSYLFVRIHNRFIVNMKHIKRIDYPNLEVTTLSYNCEQRRKTNNGCPNMNIRKDKLDTLVAEKLKEYIFTVENIPKLCEKLVELGNTRNGENQCTIKRIQKRIKRNDREKANVIKAIKNGLNAEDFKDELDRLREEKTVLENSLEEIKTKNKDGTITEDKIWAMKDKFTDYLTGNQNAEISCLIDTFVDTITEDNNRVIIKLNI